MKTLKVMMAGELNTNGRYEGGITYILKAIKRSSAQYKDSNIDLQWYNTCRITRSKKGNGTINFQNLENAAKNIFDLTKVVKHKKPDLVYYHTSFGYGLLKDLIALHHLKKKCNVKIIMHIHYAEMDKILPSQSYLRKLAVKYIKEVPDAIVFLSENTRKEFIRLGLDGHKCVTIYNFHTLNIGETAIQEKANNADHKELRLLFIGSIDERKGILDLLDALKEITFPYILDVCGMPTNDDIKRDFEKKCNELGTDKIHFHGYASGEEKTEILENTDVMVLPSYGEGFPIVLLEGIAAGCAIISTDVGAIPEVFGNETGQLYRPGDIKELIQCLEYMNSHWMDYVVSNYELSKKYDLRSFNTKVIETCERTMNG